MQYLITHIRIVWLRQELNRLTGLLRTQPVYSYEYAATCNQITATMNEIKLREKMTRQLLN